MYVLLIPTCSRMQGRRTRVPTEVSTTARFCTVTVRSGSASGTAWKTRATVAAISSEDSGHMSLPLCSVVFGFKNVLIL